MGAITKRLKKKSPKMFEDEEGLPLRPGRKPHRTPPKEPEDYSDTGVMEHERERREFEAWQKREREKARQERSKRQT